MLLRARQVLAEVAVPAVPPQHTGTAALAARSRSQRGPIVLEIHLVLVVVVVVVAVPPALVLLPAVQVAVVVQVAVLLLAMVLLV
jgi:hypothetical protein